MKKIHAGFVLVALCFAAAFGAGFAIYLRPADATRNSSGTYALPTPGVPFQSNQVISSTQVNNTFNDISSTLTDSLDRNGKGGMLSALRGIDGTVAAPALSWTSDTGSGLFRNAASDIRMSVNGTAKTYWNATGFGIGGAPASNLFEIVGASEPAITIQNTAMANTPKLFLGMNNGNSAAVLQTTGATNFGFKFFNGAGTSLLSIGATGGLTIPVGVAADASGFKHKRAVLGCATLAAIGAVCGTNVTWTTAFADANYTVQCFGNGVAAGVPILQAINTKIAATVNVTTVAMTAAIAQFTNIECIAVHD